MVIDAQIGQDPDDMSKPYIDGSIFAAELMQLDSQEKDYIDIWINSVGGNVIQAMSIYNAILASKTKVNTVNIGICASSAGFIYMAGRERSAWPYAKWMMHDPFIATDENGNTVEPNDGLKAMKDSIITMYSERCGLNKDEVFNMMSATTWLDCSQAVEMKICTKVLDMQKANRKPLTGDAQSMWKEAQNIYNIVKPTIVSIENSIKSSINNKMFEKIALSLGLEANATEEQINEAINGLKVASKSQSVDATKIEEAMNAIKDLGVLKADLLTAKNELAALKDSRNTELETAKNTAAVALIEKHKARLGSMSEEVRNAWIADAKNDAAATEAKILALPLRAPSANEIINKLPEGVAPTSAMGKMAEIKNRLKLEGRPVYQP